MGIRQSLLWDKSREIMSLCHKEKLTQSKKWRAGFDLLEKHNLLFEACLFNPQLDELNKLAKSYPNTSLILEHMGFPIGLGGPYASYGRSTSDRNNILEQWQNDIAAVAENKNVMVKLSGFFMPLFGLGVS